MSFDAAKLPPDAAAAWLPAAALPTGGPLTRGVRATQGKVEPHCGGALLTGAWRTAGILGLEARGLATLPTATALSPAGGLAFGDLAFATSPI